MEAEKREDILDKTRAMTDREWAETKEKLFFGFTGRYSSMGKRIDLGLKETENALEKILGKTRDHLIRKIDHNSKREEEKEAPYKTIEIMDFAIKTPLGITKPEFIEMKDPRNKGDKEKSNTYLIAWYDRPLKKDEKKVDRDIIDSIIRRYEEIKKK